MTSQCNNFPKKEKREINQYLQFQNTISELQIIAIICKRFFYLKLLQSIIRTEADKTENSDSPAKHNHYVKWNRYLWYLQSI